MAKPTLEGLPTELIVPILFHIPDLDSLRSIVISSPVCHRVYLFARWEVLSQVLERQYGGLLDPAEAITAVRSKGLPLAQYKEKAIALLDVWRRSREMSGSGVMPELRPDQPESLEELLQLLNLHRMLHFFLEDYEKNIPRPPDWIGDAEWNHTLPLELSHTEKRRFLRAVCRLQILANIFGTQEIDPDLCDYKPRNIWMLNNQKDCEHTSNEDAYRLFYGTLPLWEHDEMGCVQSYLSCKYNPISNEISEDLCRLMKETGCDYFWQIKPKSESPPTMAMDTVDHLEGFPDYFDGLASIGPEFLYRALHADRLRRRNMVMANLDCSATSFIGKSLTSDWDEMLPYIHPADRHEVQNFEYFWSTLLPTDQPNLGWKKFSLLPHTPDTYLEYALDMSRVPEGPEWAWGYALWDDERLKEWKAPFLQKSSGASEVPLHGPDD
ncbi:uncharacterized protein N7459_007240 [Penicillium hispanicum]|uniref:uncharacterized protein n=1 Tax=Penicillium hispanicum TaxID=1080232 RepID=UPI0025408827|nr:uncharacterized protein N7459_007240 [Penicillium hispanicum]KAJ5578276.1 hypothetical protein N7459_007240 [Penicillium hispanicum]